MYIRTYAPLPIIGAGNAAAFLDKFENLQFLFLNSTAFKFFFEPCNYTNFEILPTSTTGLLHRKYSMAHIIHTKIYFNIFFPNLNIGKADLFTTRRLPLLFNTL